jgi:thioredoxin 1
VPRDKKVVIDFFATWCGPCRQIAPYYEDLSKTFEGVEFLKADVDQFSDEEDRFQINVMPTFILLNKGAVFGVVEGANITKLMKLVGDLEKAA